LTKFPPQHLANVEIGRAGFASAGVRVGLEPFPFFHGYASLTKYSDQELPSNVFLMGVGDDPSKISFDHERVLSSRVGTIKAPFPKVLD
jgi:hypothetical protein